MSWINSNTTVRAALEQTLSGSILIWNSGEDILRSFSQLEVMDLQSCFDHFSSWFVLKSVKKWSNLKQSVQVLCQSSASSSYCIEVIWNNSVSAGNSHSFHGFNGKHLWFWAANSPYFCHPFFRSPLGIQPRTIWILFRPHHHHPRAHIQAITVSSTFRGGYFFPKEKPGQFGGWCLSWIEQSPSDFDHLVSSSFVQLFKFSKSGSLSPCEDNFQCYPSLFVNNNSNCRLLAYIFWEKSLWRVALTTSKTNDA